MISTELKSHFAKTRVLGQGSGRISLTEAELAWLLRLTATDLKIDLTNIIIASPREVPSFYQPTFSASLPTGWASLDTTVLLEELAHLCSE